MREAVCSGLEDQQGGLLCCYVCQHLVRDDLKTLLGLRVSYLPQESGSRCFLENYKMEIPGSHVF